MKIGTEVPKPQTRTERNDELEKLYDELVELLENKTLPKDSNKKTTLKR